MSPLRAEAVLAHLDGADRRAIEAFRQRVRERFGARLRDVRLYGSKARGDDHPESDIDILVLVSNASWDDREAAFEIAWSIDPRLRPHLNDFDGYHSPRSRATGFYKEMRKESVRL